MEVVTYLTRTKAKTLRFASKIFALKIQLVFFFWNFRKEKGTGAEMCRAIVSGMVTGDAPVSYWPFFRCP